MADQQIQSPMSPALTIPTSKKILLIEKNDLTNRVMSRVLEQSGFQVVITTNPLDGLAAAQRDLPDLILMGTWFYHDDTTTEPWETDGLLLLQKIKGTGCFKGIPVIIASADCLRGDIECAMEAGADAHLVLPAQPKEIRFAVHKVLGCPDASPGITPPQATAPLNEPAPLAALLPLRILLVDDNDINNQVHSRILHQLGYQPAVAHNGREALDLLDRQPFDLVFMDTMMPVMDGLDATRQLRQRQTSGQYPHCPEHIIVIALTPHALSGDREKHLAAGMDDYLALPVRPGELRKMIERWGENSVAEIKPPKSVPLPVNPAAVPVVDMERINDLTDGNPDLLRELVEIYFQGALPQFTQMTAAIRDDQPDALRRAAHNCAGASAALGMNHLVPHLRALEKLAASGNISDAERTLKLATIEFHRVIEFFKTLPALATLEILRHTP
jgi:CheY-like chemotaxis protein/HPt (histidine-containing phosphotransfer) domain-containing protein